MFQTLWTKWWSFSPKKIYYWIRVETVVMEVPSRNVGRVIGRKGETVSNNLPPLELHNQTRCHQTSSGSSRFTQPCCTRWSPSAGPAGARWKWNRRLRFKRYFLNSISQPAFRHLRPRLRWFSRNYHLFLTFRHMRPRSSYAVQVIA